VTKVVGAVPVIVVLGLVVAVPPEILHVVPSPETVGWYQVVVNVSVVLPALTAAAVTIYSPVYGEAALFSWNSVVEEPPAVN